VGPFASAANGLITDPVLLRAVFAGLVLLMCLLWAAAAAWADALSRGQALGVVGAASVLIVLAPPLLLTDVFNYLAFARLGVQHGLNPYLNAPADVPHDSILPYVTWRRHRSAYGPLFTLLTYPTAWLGIVGGVWALKAVTVAAAVWCAGLVGACAERLGRSPGRAVLLMGLNPILLVYAVGGAHNDYLMVLGLLGGTYLVLTGRERAAPWAVVAAIGMKASALLITPFVLLGARDRRATALVFAVAAALLALLTALVFGTHAPGLAEQQSAATRFSIPHVLATLVGHGEYRQCANLFVCSPAGVELAATAVLAVGMAGLLWATWRGLDWVTAAGWAGILLVVTLGAVFPWYLLWPLPFAILSRSSALQAATAALAGFLLVTHQPFLYLVAWSYHHLLLPVLP
jgi:hypothetical protein